MYALPLDRTVMSIRELRAALSGRLITPGDAGYDQARTVFYGGIVLDLRDLQALDIDLEGRTAWAQTGLTASAYTSAVGAHGLATGFGDTASVGIGGLTLGGGIGYLVRKHGLTIDSLLAAELVTPTGRSCGWMTGPIRTCSGRSAAAAATSASPPDSSSACIPWTRSWAACWCSRPPPRLGPRHRPAGPRPPRAARRGHPMSRSAGPR
jgi:FAD binding domain